MEATEVRIGKEVLLDIGTHSEWFISSVGYNGESVDITLRRKADIDKDWWRFVDTPQTAQKIAELQEMCGIEIDVDDFIRKLNNLKMEVKDK